MKIIRDNQLFGLGMIPLLVDWGIKRCNEGGCKNKPNTIVVLPEGESPTGSPLHFGLCEEHYQWAAATEGEVGIEVEPPYRNLSFAIAGRIEFDLETRQHILELPTEESRLQKVRELLTEAAENLERDKRAREKAETNGHLRGDWKPKEGS